MQYVVKLCNNVFSYGFLYKRIFFELDETDKLWWSDHTNMVVYDYKAINQKALLK